MPRIRRAAASAVLLWLTLPSLAFPQTEGSLKAFDVALAQSVKEPTALDRPARLRIINAPLDAVLGELRRTSGVELVFSPTLLPPRRVSCDCMASSVGESLALILRGTSLRFQEMHGQVVIVPSPTQARSLQGVDTIGIDIVPAAEMPAEIASALAQLMNAGTVRGQVTDVATGQPLSGAEITITTPDRETRSVITDDQGRYAATVPAGRLTIRAELLGYSPQRQEVTVVEGESAVANFELRQTAIGLDELVVTATGQTRRKEIAHSTSVINTSELRVPAVKGVEEMFVARAPGVYVLANSGQPGAGGTIRIRGNNSVSQSNHPIVYVDGVRVFSEISPTHDRSSQGILPINDINSTDIERIEIVKGAAATTLYGTEASAGVIQIFTKRGGTGAATWSAEITTGFNNSGHIGPKEDPDGMWLNNCRGTKVTGGGVRFEDPTCPASGSWVRNGPIQKYSLSVRGGSPQFGYYVSGHYSDEQGVTQTMGSTLSGFRGNFVFRPLEPIEVSLHTSYTNRNTQWLTDSGSGEALLLNVHRGPFGNFRGGTGCTEPDVICLNNAAIFDLENTTKADHHIMGGSVQYTPRDWLVSRLSVGYDNNNLAHESFTPFGFYTDPAGAIAWSGWHQKMITADLATSIERPIGRSLMSTTSFGGQTVESRLFRANVSGEGFAGPGRATISSAAVRSGGGSGTVRVINAGFYAQQMLGWRDELFLTAGLRVDGNSAFGRDFGLQPYPKVGLSYAVTEQRLPGWLNQMKVRAAIGESGKAPGAFDAVQTWRSIAADDGQPGFTPDGRGNPSLGPERTRELEAGFEASVGGGRFEVDFTYYNQRTRDALVPVQYPPTEGFTNRQLENIGVLEAKGTETRLQALLVQTRDLEWNARLDYSTTKSKAIDIGGEIFTVQSSAVSYVQEGLPVPSYIGKVILNPNEFADPIIEENAFIGAPFPDRIIGAGSSIRLFGRLHLEAIGEWQLGGHLINRAAYVHSPLGTWYPCYEAQEKLRAAAAGDPSALAGVTALERARCDLSGNVRAIDFWVEKTDFFMLRSVSLTYDLPNRLTPRGFGPATITLAGRNLWRVTDYTGTDPETSNNDVSAFSRRDSYVFPRPRTFLLTLRTQF